MYSLRFALSVAAGAGEVVTLSDIMYMQDMTSDICNSTPAPTADDVKNKTYEEIIAATPSKQLKDSRDDKYYWIAKLADGNCWMTQNLDFDVPVALYHEDSDVLVDTLTGTTRVIAPGSWPKNNDNPNYNGYYDPGDYYYNGPNGNHSQDTNISCHGITNGLNNSKCALFISTIANTNASNDTNAHYHIGNYYSFSAATVKSGDDLTSGSALNSICPKGWALPTSGSASQFAELLTKYGVNINLTSGNYAIYKEPLYLVFGGFLESSTLSNAGGTGSYWSSAGSTTSAFSLRFNSSVTPAGSADRYDGFSVRCVAE